MSIILSNLKISGLSTYRILDAPPPPPGEEFLPGDENYIINFLVAGPVETFVSTDQTPIISFQVGGPTDVFASTNLENIVLLSLDTSDTITIVNQEEIFVSDVNFTIPDTITISSTNDNIANITFGGS